MVRHGLALVVLAFGGLVLGSGIGCGGDDSGGGGSGHSGPPGGPAEGPADAHCNGKPVQPTSQQFCMMGDGGAGGGGGQSGAAEEYGETMYGTEGDDDECKYRITWSSTDVYQDTDVTFTVVLTSKTDGSPVTGAEPLIESFLNDIHPAPNNDSKTVEDPPGTYKIGPMQFDAAGEWTVRFHFFDDCLELSEKTPHGHAAFFVDVP